MKRIIARLYITIITVLILFGLIFLLNEVRVSRNQYINESVRISEETKDIIETNWFKNKNFENQSLSDSLKDLMNKTPNIHSIIIYSKDKGLTKFNSRYNDRAFLLNNLIPNDPSWHMRPEYTFNGWDTFNNNIISTPLQITERGFAFDLIYNVLSTEKVSKIFRDAFFIILICLVFTILVIIIFSVWKTKYSIKEYDDDFEPGQADHHNVNTQPDNEPSFSDDSLDNLDTDLDYSDINSLDDFDMDSPDSDVDDFDLDSDDPFDSDETEDIGGLDDFDLDSDSELDDFSISSDAEESNEQDSLDDFDLNIDDTDEPEALDDFDLDIESEETGELDSLDDFELDIDEPADSTDELDSLDDFDMDIDEPADSTDESDSLDDFDLDMSDDEPNDFEIEMEETADDTDLDDFSLDIKEPSDDLDDFDLDSKSDIIEDDLTDDTDIDSLDDFDFDTESDGTEDNTTDDTNIDSLDDFDFDTESDDTEDNTTDDTNIDSLDDFDFDTESDDTEDLNLDIEEQDALGDLTESLDDQVDDITDGLDDFDEMNMEPEEVADDETPTSFKESDEISSDLSSLLEKAGVSDNDLSVAVINIDDENTQKHQNFIEKQFGEDAVVYKLNEKQIAVTLKDTNIDNAVTKVNEVISLGKEENLSMTVGISSMSDRRVGENRLLGEAIKATDKAKELSKEMLAFRPDPKKYKDFIKNS